MRSAKLKDILNSFPFLFVFPFLIYLLTLSPTIYVRDAGLSVAGAYSLGVANPPGFPIYYLMGRLFTLLPIGDVAFRVNLMSAFFGALAIMLVGRGIEVFLEIAGSRKKVKEGVISQFPI